RDPALGGGCRPPPNTTSTIPATVVHVCAGCVSNASRPGERPVAAACRSAPDSACEPLAQLCVPGLPDTARKLAAHLADRTESLREHLVVVDRLEVHLAREEEVPVRKRVVTLERRLERDPDRVLDEAWLQMRVLDHEQLVGPL